MVGRVASVLCFLFAMAFNAHAADPVKPEFPQPQTCIAQPDDPTIADAEKAKWSDCEKWVWSCIREGNEANLFTKECLTPRTPAQKGARDRFRLAPFYKPDDFQASNALGDRFLIAILTNPAYSARIGATGVRIFGGYFKEPVNLENVSASTNLVLDGSMMQRGLRMTNFRSSHNLSLDGSNIRGSLLLMRARVDGSLFMENGVFDTVDLRDARIGSSVEGSGSIFNYDFQFDRADIDGKLILVKSRLTLFKGWDSHVGGSLELRLADVRRKIDLTGARIDGDVRMQDVTFGRQPRPNDSHCDWDPGIPGNHLLSDLKTSLSPENFEVSLNEIVGSRPSYAGVQKANPCAPIEGAPKLVRNEALLRDMKIQGTLCIVDVSGDIAAGPGGIEKHIDAISLDGTTAKSTVLSWKPSKSGTLWRAVNYTTGSMLINLNEQPARHFIDNLDIGSITFARGMGEASAEDLEGQAEEFLVKYKCDPTSAVLDQAESRDTQDRIARFFRSDLSGSAQPFSAVVEKLNASGIATLRLKKSLSAFQNRNACTYSEFSKTYRELDWVSAPKAWRTAMEKRPPDTSKPLHIVNELGFIGVDAGCNALHFALKHMVYYGHEPWRLILWALAAVLLFRLLLMLEKRTPGQEMVRRRLGLAYAFDNLIPVRMYRINPYAADELPNSKFLRFWRALHRGFGLALLVFFFFFVYKAST